MKIKIYFFYPNIINDGIKKTFEVYNNYLKKKYDIVLITNSEKRLVKNSKNIEIQQFKINIFKNIKFINSILCIFKFLQNKEKKKIIFSLDVHLFLLILKLLGFNFKLILRTPNPIFNMHNKDESKFLNERGFTNKYELYLYKFADLVITYSKSNTLTLKQVFNVKNSHHVNNYFINLKKKKIFKIKKYYNVFFIGRFVNSKDPIFFLKNLIDLSNKINIKIYLIGEGDLLAKLTDIAKEYKNKVEIIKYTKEPFEKYHRKIDLFCVTSKFDGTPNVLGEAIGYSIPCVAPKNIGLSNILLNYGKGGYLYKQGNDKSFKKVITLAIKNYKLSLKKTNIASTQLNEFTEEKTLGKIERLISKI